MLQTTKRQTIRYRALNPRFWMPIFGQKTGFRAHMNQIKSGIPCSDSIATHCSRRLMRVFFVSPSANMLQTTKNQTRKQRIAVISCVCRGKPILQIFYKHQTIRSQRIAVMNSCVCFVSPSCKYVTNYKASNHSIATHRSRRLMRVIFCKPILQICYKLQSVKPFDGNASQSSSHACDFL
jgi:hypothetical protein